MGRINLSRWIGLATAGATAAGLVLVVRWLAFQQSRSNARQDAQFDVNTHESDKTLENVWVVFNPAKQSDTEQFQAHVEEVARSCNVSHIAWIETSEEDPGTGQAIEALTKGASLVIAAGGDGTVRAVAASLAHSGVPMGIIPAGTGNLLARNLNIPTDDLDEAIRIALGSTFIHGDLAWLRMEDPDEVGDLTAEGQLIREARERLDANGDTIAEDDEFAYTVIAGMGFDGETMANTDSGLKKKIGWIAYVISGVKALHGKRMKASLKLKDAVSADQSTVAPDLAEHSDAQADEGDRPDIEELSDVPARTIMVANCGELPYLVLVPDADPTDGLLDVVAVDVRAGLLGWADVAGKILAQGAGWTPLDLPASTGHMTARQCRDVKVDVDQPRIVQVDGDPVGTASTVHVRVDESAVDIAVPRQ